MSSSTVSSVGCCLPTTRTPRDAQIRVRAAGRYDVMAMLPLWREMMAEHLTLHPAFALAQDADARWQEGIVAMLARRDAFVLLACRGRHILGFCNGWSGLNPAVYVAHRVGAISELCVAKAARRAGVGRALVAGARRWFDERGLTEFQLSTAMGNVAGRAFWQSMGGEALLVRYRFAVDEPHARTR